MAATERKRVNLRDVIKALAADQYAVVYVTDGEALWQLDGVERGSFVLSDCGQPYGRNVRHLNVTAVELALGYDHVEPHKAPLTPRSTSGQLGLKA